eukprot:146174_1
MMRMQSTLTHPNLLIILPIVAVFFSLVIACVLSQLLLNIRTNDPAMHRHHFMEMFDHLHCYAGQTDHPWRWIHLFGICVSSTCVIYMSCLKRYLMNKLWRYPAYITWMFVIGSLSYIVLPLTPFDVRSLRVIHNTNVVLLFVLYDLGLLMDVIHWIKYIKHRNESFHIYSNAYALTCLVIGQIAIVVKLTLQHQKDKRMTHYQWVAIFCLFGGLITQSIHGYYIKLHLKQKKLLLQVVPRTHSITEDSFISVTMNV